MAEFLRQIIPVSLPLRICFFLIPCAAALSGQILLCLRAKKTAAKFLPLIVAACIPVLVYGCHFAHILQTVFGGFTGLLLLGTAGFIAGGSILGWAAYGMTASVRKKKK